MCVRASAAADRKCARPKAPGSTAKLGSLLAKAEDGSMARPHAPLAACWHARRIARRGRTATSRWRVRGQAHTEYSLLFGGSSEYCTLFLFGRGNLKPMYSRPPVYCAQTRGTPERSTTAAVSAMTVATASTMSEALPDFRMALVLYRGQARPTTEAKKQMVA